MTASPSTRRTPSHPGRVVVVVALVAVLGLLVIVLGATQRSGDVTGTPGGVDVEGGAGAGTGGGAGGLQPAAIEAIGPSPGDLVGPFADVKVDLANGYVGALQIDGREIPDDQTIRVDGLGQITFRPGPGKDIERFEPGVYDVRVVYWPLTSTRSDSAATFDWSFRVGGA